MGPKERPPSDTPIITEKEAMLDLLLSKSTLGYGSGRIPYKAIKYARQCLVAAGIELKSPILKEKEE